MKICSVCNEIVSANQSCNRSDCPIQEPSTSADPSAKVEPGFTGRADRAVQSGLDKTADAARLATRRSVFIAAAIFVLVLAAVAINFKKVSGPDGFVQGEVVLPQPPFDTDTQPVAGDAVDASAVGVNGTADDGKAISQLVGTWSLDGKDCAIPEASFKGNGEYLDSAYSGRWDVVNGSIQYTFVTGPGDDGSEHQEINPPQIRFGDIISMTDEAFTVRYSDGRSVSWWRCS